MRDGSGVLQDKGQRETQPQDIPAPLSCPRWALEGPVNVWCVLADQTQDILASTPGVSSEMRNTHTQNLSSKSIMDFSAFTSISQHAQCSFCPGRCPYFKLSRPTLFFLMTFWQTYFSIGAPANGQELWTCRGWEEWLYFIYKNQDSYLVHHLTQKMSCQCVFFVVSSNWEPGSWDLWKMYLFLMSFYGISNTFITSCYTVVIINIYENSWLKSCWNNQTRCFLSCTKVFWSKVEWLYYNIERPQL